LIIWSDLSTHCSTYDLVTEANSNNANPILCEDLPGEFNETVDPWRIVKGVVSYFMRGNVSMAGLLDHTAHPDKQDTNSTP
jgi:hypothetical protein